MPSLIPGFEYDIFISYRQKDNKGDRWVSEFVEALKTELESTFKEEVSVYFDINPHDGLLETHDVDESLKEKLKCLVFIPVISRTYCDPNSFAWEHEFKAFVEQASEDQFGLKVKLPGGNVASRVLPVRIHDLDNEDIRLCESVLGGVLRGIEFIFKSPGVNRPLHPKEENPQDNQNHTFYRDQINKVANAVKEIVAGLKQYENSENSELSEEESELLESADEENVIQQKKRKIGITLMVLLFLFIGSLLVFQFVFRNKPAANEIEKTIAVLPFQNLSNDSTQLWFCDGFVEDIRNNLQKVKSYTVRSKLSSDQYRDQKKSTRIIGNELNVNYLVGGSVGREGDNIKIWVHLSDSKADKQIWSNEYTRSKTQIFSLQSEIARGIVSELNTVLSPEEMAGLEKIPTKNQEAYNYYLQGRFFWNKRTDEGLKKSIEYFSESIKEDPDYALAYAGLADAYYILAWWGWYSRPEGYTLAKEYALKALNIDKNLADAHATLGTLLCWSDWKWGEAGKELKLATELNPNNSIAHQYYSELLDIIRNNQEARLEIDKALELDPFSTAINATSALYYYNDGKFGEAVNAYNRTLEINPDFIQSHIMNFEIYIRQGEGLKALEALQQYMLSDTLTSKIAGPLKEIYNKSGKDGLLSWLIESQRNNPAAGIYIAKCYALLGKKKEALDCLKKIIEMHFSEERGTENFPDEIPRIYNSPGFDNLRSEPDFQAIIKKMGLTEYVKQ
jgi:TolB-like protein/Tfp pilus assembly protein PilF